MEVRNIFQKILLVYSSVKTVYKDAEITAGKSSYSVVTHDSVTRLLHDPISQAGIVPFPNQKSCSVVPFEKIIEYNGQKQSSIVYRADVHAEVRFVNADNPSEVVISEAHAYAFDNSDKAIGKAYSMALKMIYLKVFMLESQDDEESRAVEPGSTYSIKKSAPVAKPAPKSVDVLTGESFADYKINAGPNNKLTGTKLTDHTPEFLLKTVESSNAYHKSNNKVPHKNTKEFTDMVYAYLKHINFLPF
jgi:hypothetical protein